MRETRAIAIAGYALCIFVGLTIVLLREPLVLWLGLVGVALAFFYHAPPFKLSYHGWGEGAVFVAYGPLICAGTYLVMTRTLPTWVVWLGLPSGGLSQRVSGIASRTGQRAGDQPASGLLPPASCLKSSNGSGNRIVAPRSPATCVIVCR